MCSHGDVRLVGGGSDLQGRVEFCAGGEWATICSNGWDEREASVVCRQLGHSGDGKSVLFFLRKERGLVTREGVCHLLPLCHYSYVKITCTMYSDLCMHLYTFHIKSMWSCHGIVRM